MSERQPPPAAELDRTLDCVHCGLCLSACPTYEVTGREADSPRGRIYLMRGAAEGRFELSAAALRRLDECIVCRGCESACPSGIRMGEMVESFRARRARESGRRRVSEYVARFFLRHVLPHRNRIAALTDLLYVAEELGLRRIARAVARRVLPRLAAMEALLPPMPRPAVRRIPTDRQRPEGYHATGPARMRVALFLGCITAEWFAATHRATIRVLTRNGIDVVIPDGQTCCGALHRHAGLVEDAEDLLRRNAEVFSSLKIDAVVVNAAGCGASLKEPPPGAAGGLGVPVRDICELLDEVGIVRPARHLGGEGRTIRVAYQQPCHLLHAQGIGPDPVRRLLETIDGIEWVPLPRSDRCCGSGGVYNLLEPRIARKILEDKVEAVRRTGARIVVTGNPGCVLQLRSGLAQRGVEVLHPVELLARGYDGPRGGSTASGPGD